MPKERYVVVVHMETELIVEAESHTEAAHIVPNNVSPVRVRKEKEFDADLMQVVIDDCVFCGIPLLSNAHGTFTGVRVPDDKVPSDIFPFSSGSPSCCQTCADKKGITGEK